MLDLSIDLKQRSVFLFGPRQTGKTTWLKICYPESTWFNLLRGDVFLRLSSNPGRIHEELKHVNPKKGPVIIDEIQKMPGLLDDVHHLIESEEFRFILTGSSPVKLRRSGVNLLGGRARVRFMHPFVSAEVPDWNIDKALLFGEIPSIYLSEEPEEELYSYCGSYLQLEIQAEGLVRGIESFSRFLHAAAVCNTEQVVFERIANDAQVPGRTVREFYQVLQDTLIGFMLEPFTPGKYPKRKPVSHGKFYFFDGGVANALCGITSLSEKTTIYGKALEQLIFQEIRAWMSYRKDRRKLKFWRTVDGAEVDFVIEEDLAIEVKASTSLSGKDFRGLNLLLEDAQFRHCIIVCREPVRRHVKGIDIIPVELFLKSLWEGEFNL